MAAITEEVRAERERVRKQFALCEVKASGTGFLTEEVFVAADDGTGLRTIIYRPETDAALPVIAVRTCYPQNDPVYRATAEEYAKRGFAYVFQYCRGTGGSEGEWEPNVNDRADGIRFLEWLSGRPFTAVIGYSGCSYLAFTGWVMADCMPEKVKALYLTHYGTFRHVSAYKDGLFRHDILTAWAMENAGFPVTADYLASCRYRPQEEVDEALWGKKLHWYRKWIMTPDAGDPYWNTDFWGMMKEIPGKIKIPVFIGEGWYDHHLGSAIETWRALSEECRGKSVFSIGAWNHSFEPVVHGHPGEHFAQDDVLRAFHWFYDILVKDKLPQPGINAYVTGADKWIHTDSLNENGTAERRFYLSVTDGEKTLSDFPDDEPQTLSYVYDPEDPAPTTGAESCFHSVELQGSLPQPQPGYRPDVLSFVSGPLPEDLTVFGPVRVSLSVSSDAEDTAFAVRLSEVLADGRAFNIRSGITTLAYRNDSPVRMSYSPGETVEVTIRMWEIAWQLKKGSRIRLDITSSDFPQYAIHSNYPGVWAGVTKTKRATQTIMTGGSSCVTLPLIEL